MTDVAFFVIRSIPARAGETPPEETRTFTPTVYPRTGGGNTLPMSLVVATTGLSPHGRGKRRGGPGRHLRLRSIPARAGETIYTRPFAR